MTRFDSRRRTFTALSAVAGWALALSGALVAVANEPLADATLLELPPVNPLSASLLDEQPLTAASPLTSSLVVDPNVAPASFEHYSSDGYETGTGSAWGQPINWTAGPYLKSGVSLALGDGMLEGDQSAGYTIAGGMRQPLPNGIAGDKVFIDLGGSYLSVFGQTNRVTAGSVFNVITQTTTIDADAFASTLKEFQRATVHTAIGYYWGSPVDERNGGWDMRLATRFGGRAGQMRGRFDEVLDPALDLPTLRVTPTHAKTDVSGGLFLGVEAIVLRQATPYGTVQWTLDSEFANDWVSFEGFKTDSNTATASIMLGFMLSR